MDRDQNRSGAWSGGQRGWDQRSDAAPRRDGARYESGQRGGDRWEQTRGGTNYWPGAAPDGDADAVEFRAFVLDAWQTRRVDGLYLFRLEMSDGSVRTVAVRPGLAERLREMESRSVRVRGVWDRIGGRETLRLTRLRVLM